MTNLTDNERAVLLAICASNYNDAETVVDHMVWTFSVTDELPAELAGKTYSGIVSSLNKKGLALSEDYETPNDVISITQAGLDVIGGDPR